jgi:hypothetical protein
MTYFVQTSDVPDLANGFGIPPEGKVYACENVRIRCGDYDGAPAYEVADGFMWVHLARAGICVQKGFPTLEEAETAAQERARRFGGTFVHFDASEGRQ